jgi:hypothetical protein
MANLSIKVSQRGSARGPLLYVGIAVAIAIWSMAVLLFAINIVPIDVYWLSYYAVDYTFGFASSSLTQDLLGWRPTQPELIDDLGQGHYFHELSRP